jgi:hypothetical protein
LADAACTRALAVLVNRVVNVPDEFVPRLRAETNSELHFRQVRRLYATEHRSGVRRGNGFGVLYLVRARFFSFTADPKNR